MIKKGLSFLVFISITVFAFSQGKAPSIISLIEKDTTITKGVYIIENNVKVTKNATLTINPGVKFYLKNGASIRVDGGIKVAGNARNIIEFTSQNEEEEGYGIIITGSNPEKEISIEYANFNHLLIPLNFEKNWIRKSVLIKNCSFQEINTGEASIIISRPDELSAENEIPFVFSLNNFVFNNSSIFIENLDSDVLNLQFFKNLITSNYYYGYELGGGIYAPINATINNPDAKFTGTFLANSLYQNYLLHDSNDSIVKEVNFGIKGRAEKYSLDNNYFGLKSVAEIQKTFDHSINDPNAPFITTGTPMKNPHPSTHGHIYKVLFNGVEPQNNRRPYTDKEDLKVTIIYNRPFLIKDGVNYVSYTYLNPEDGKTYTVGLVSKFDIDKANNTLNFVIKNDVYVKYPQGYFTIRGLVDEENFMVPKEQYGKELFNFIFDKKE